MSRTYTAAQITAIGGREWEKNGKHRVYLNNWGALVKGLEISHYNTGNISYAALDGEKISNSRAYKMLCAISKVWWDAADGTIWISGDWNARHGETEIVAERIHAGIADAVAALVPPAVELTVKQAAEKLAVSTRTVQRRAAAGRLTARKDDHGRWIITL